MPSDHRLNHRAHTFGMRSPRFCNSPAFFLPQIDLGQSTEPDSPEYWQVVYKSVLQSNGRFLPHFCHATTISARVEIVRTLR